jgi:DUF1016 N-terminal domain
MQFAQVFPEQAIVVALIRQLSWTKILALIPIKNDLKRTFCVEMAQLEHWSSRQLQERISSQLFERTALSKNPSKPFAPTSSNCVKRGELLLKCSSKTRTFWISWACFKVMPLKPVVQPKARQARGWQCRLRLVFR